MSGDPMKSVVASVAVVAAAIVVGAQGDRTEAQSASPNASAEIGVVIRPSAVIQVGKATLWTPGDRERFEAEMGDLKLEEADEFETDLDPNVYQSMKMKAEREAAFSRPLTLAPEPEAPATLKVINFEGISQGPACGTCRPPDTFGAVGVSHFVEVVNTRIVVYNKAEPTPALLLSTNLAAFFGATEALFDPRVVYDQTWNRWVIVATRRAVSATDAVRRWYLAVSTTSNPTGSFFKYVVSFGGGPFNAGDWWDYPHLGMDQDAVLVTGNIFDTPTGPFRFAAMMPFAKARVYNGLGFSVPVFTGLAATLAPPIVLDQNKDAYFVAANNFTSLHLYRGENMSNAGEATMTLQALVDVPDYAVPPSAPQPSTAEKLDTLDRRFVNASTQYGDSLWNVHTINRAGFATPRFYQIDTEGPGANTLKQSGFFFESGTSHDFNATIAANTLNEAFVTWNSTDATNPLVSLRHQARVRISGRQGADPLGVIPAGTALFTSPASYNPSTATVERWGDYSVVSPDPTAVVGCAANRRAWVVNERIIDAATWGTRIARIGFCP
jgi:hypothetical protein